MHTMLAELGPASCVPFVASANITQQGVVRASTWVLDPWGAFCVREVPFDAWGLQGQRAAFCPRGGALARCLVAI